jgi:hypothetical protein
LAVLPRRVESDVFVNGAEREVGVQQTPSSSGLVAAAGDPDGGDTCHRIWAAVIQLGQ